MNVELNEKSRSRVAVSAAAQAEAGVVARGAWHRPAVTVIDVKRTMAALGAYLDGGTGSSF